jgi:UDP-N-acetylmuramoylalanine--D-glutamate ligase
MESQENAEPFELLLPGAHNQANAQAAWTAARQLGGDRATAQEALREFKGLPHRLQFVCERGGVRYFNDSKCTTPEGAIVALESFEPRKVIQIVGGYDKHANFDAFGAALAARAKTVVALGVTKDQIVAAVEKAISATRMAANDAAMPPKIVISQTFDAAVAAAKQSAAPGDVVLLSPACASWDMFTNYEKRGERFVELVTQ